MTGRRRTGALIVGFGLLFGTVLGGVLTGRERARSQLDDQLVAEADIQTAVFAEYLARAKDVATLDRLIDWGCELGQGYLIARPMPLDELLAWVRTTGREGLSGWPRRSVPVPAGATGRGAAE